MSTERRFLPVSVVVAGVQKGATSTLHGLLVRHRAIARHGLKERHFFDDDKRDWSSPDYSEYGTVPGGPATRAIDSTPSYFFWPGAMERIAAYDRHLAAEGGPSVRLLLSFRDPIERAFSQWTMVTDKAAGVREYPSFGELIRMRTPGLDEVPAGWSKRDARQFSVVARGLYGSHLHADTYADDLMTFTRLSGLDTSGWSTQRILDGDLDPEELAERLARKAGMLPAPR